MSEGTILVVDDEENVATTIRAILQLEGYDVTAVTTGTEALGLIGQREFDVVLTDLRLGDTDGIDILREVQRRSPDTAAIMLTGYASLDSAVAALRAGAYDYLMKPSDVEELRATVARGLERRALRRRLVELEEVDRLKTQFLSMASHELRTPLTAVSGYLQVAQRRILRELTGDNVPEHARDEAQRAAATLDQAHRQTHRLARLIDDLLDVSRLETGRVELRRSHVDLGGLVREVVDRVRLTDADALIDVERSDDGVHVLGDQHRLEQVVENLLGNALKYSPRGAPVRIALARDREHVHLAVRDEGIGIAADELTRIFDLFYRARDHRAHDAEGLGLGLYITREIVTRHGGSITAESVVGRGSTFHVHLPVAMPQSGEAPPRDRAGATTG